MASSGAQTSLLESFSADVLLVDSELTTAKIAPTLRSSYRVAISPSVATARAFLGRNSVAVIVADLDGPDGAAIDLCRGAKALPNPPQCL